MSGDVRVVYTKYDGSLHWHRTVRRLGTDAHGTWVGAGAGATIRRGEGPEVVLTHPHVGLFPRDQWWTAWFNGAPEGVEVYVDVTTPPVWGDTDTDTDTDTVTMVDLDLDVLRVRATGEVLIVDQDEFAEHGQRFGYPADVVERATGAAAWLRDALTTRHPPFADESRPWLGLLDPAG